MCLIVFIYCSPLARENLTICKIATRQQVVFCGYRSLRDSRTYTLKTKVENSADVLTMQCEQLIWLQFPYQRIQLCEIS